MRPRIQLSGLAGQMNRYIDAVRYAGGVPLPGDCPSPEADCDGLILCGGGDADPALYGQENRGSQPPDLDRDRAELALLGAYWEAGKPVLGVCRGVQMINIFWGGTLRQDLPEEVRAFHKRPDGDAVHPVRTVRDSTLSRLYGETLAVNSAHHQAVDRLGRGLKAMAWSEGGVLEALEHESGLALGVQFHPERMSYAYRRADLADGAPILLEFMRRCQEKRDRAKR